MIKPIDEIPLNVSEQRNNYRQMIRNDILEAMDKGILKFEFVGEYNYKYLAQYAREEAESIVRKMVFDYSKRHPEYKERHKYCFFSYWEVNRKKGIIRISSIKGETPEKRRVFCSIHPDIDEALSEYAEQKIKEHEDRERRKQEESEG